MEMSKKEIPMKTTILNLILFTITFRHGHKPDGSKADWTLFIKLPNNFIIGIGSFWGNCFSGLVLTVDKHHLQLKLLYKHTESHVSLQFFRTSWLINGQPKAPNTSILEAKRLGHTISTKHHFLPRLYWHSTYIARHYGKTIEAPHGTCFIYSGWLGHHQDL